MVRQKVEVRREEILVATLREIEASGMAALRVTDIASSLGVSSGLIFYHFETKAALLAAALAFAVERDLARLDTALARGCTPTERLRRVVASYGPTGAAPGWRLWIDAWATSLREPTIGQALRRLDSRWRHAMEAAIADGVEIGDFSCDDPTAAVTRIGALLDGLSVGVLVYKSITRTQLRGWVRAATASEVGIDPAALA